jgi:hypothetical protein
MSDCGCFYLADEEDCDNPRIVTSRLVIAGKKHVCCECGEAINPGTQHEYTSGIWEGGWGHFRTCIGCYRVRENYCCSWEFGKVAEQLEYELGFDYRRVEQEEGNEP